MSRVRSVCDGTFVERIIAGGGVLRGLFYTLFHIHQKIPKQLKPATGKTFSRTPTTLTIKNFFTCSKRKEGTRARTKQVSIRGLFVPFFFFSFSHRFPPAYENLNLPSFHAKNRSRASVLSPEPGKKNISHSWI